MNKNVERLYNGIWKENPTFVLMLGMCPTLAVTTSAINGVGMGLSTTVVLVLSNMVQHSSNGRLSTPSGQSSFINSSSLLMPSHRLHHPLSQRQYLSILPLFPQSLAYCL